MPGQLGQKIITEITPRQLLYKTPRPVMVCAYVRVSTNHDDQLSSFQSQAAYYQDKFSQVSNRIVVGIFSDAGISGAKENRPGFQAMLSKARNGEIDLIYTKSISRFARNTLLLLNVVRELREIGVGIIFEEQNINTLRAEGELMLTVLAGIAEEERKSVRSNVQWALKNKCLRGEVMVDTNRLIGYSKNQSGKLVIDSVQAEVVKKIYQLYLNGLWRCGA
jgi:DNA invertase Pin-like site-specific DNA recombinase